VNSYSEPLAWKNWLKGIDVLPSFSSRGIPPKSRNRSTPQPPTISLSPIIVLLLSWLLLSGLLLSGLLVKGDHQVSTIVYISVIERVALL